jgi:hypothetical protein
MVATALSATFLAGVYSTFIQQRRMAVQQEQLLEARQIARLAMDALVEELRDAGFDPGGLASAGIVDASATRLRFTRDLNCNGTLSSSNSVTPAKNTPDTSDEDIAYFLDIPKQTLRRLPYINGTPSSGGAQPVASNILAFHLCYLLAPDALGQCIATPAVLDLPQIRAVQVTLTARATNVDTNYTDPDLHQKPAYAHYRKATLTALVRFRNLGLNRGGTPGQPPAKVDFDDPCTLP